MSRKVEYYVYIKNLLRVSDNVICTYKWKYIVSDVNLQHPAAISILK